MKRIKNIDLLRAGAILYIMLYHCYVLSGQPWQAHTAIHDPDTWRRRGRDSVFPAQRIWNLSFPLFFGRKRLSPWLAGFYEKTLHPYHASVLRLRYSSSDFYVNTDVQQ